jgi:hypothetical protein
VAHPGRSTGRRSVSLVELLLLVLFLGILGIVVGPLLVH